MVMEILVQKSVRCILSGEGGGVVACDIFLIGGSAICDSLWQRVRGLNLVQTV